MSHLRKFRFPHSTFPKPYDFLRAFTIFACVILLYSKIKVIGTRETEYIDYMYLKTNLRQRCAYSVVATVSIIHSYLRVCSTEL